MKKRWLLTSEDVNGKVVHSQRFYEEHLARLVGKNP